MQMVHTREQWYIHEYRGTSMYAQSAAYTGTVHTWESRREISPTATECNISPKKAICAIRPTTECNISKKQRCVQSGGGMWYGCNVATKGAYLGAVLHAWVSLYIHGSRGTYMDGCRGTWPCMQSGTYMELVRAEIVLVLTATADVPAASVAHRSHEDRHDTRHADEEWFNFSLHVSIPAPQCVAAATRSPHARPASS